jgi:nitronate monooxygenase
VLRGALTVVLVSLLEQLALKHAIVQAGMGGGIATGQLAGAVSAAGALGTVGILPPQRLREELLHARELAPGRPIAANLLVPFATRGHVEACRSGGASMVALHGGFDRRLTSRLREARITVLQTVGARPQAKRGLAEGADGLIVQGSEAGGHLVGVEPALAALEQVLAVSGPHPVLLAGGVAGASDVRRALDAGAAAVVAGTRFLLTHECAAHPEYKQRVLEATRTIETQLFGLGWPMRHRVVPNAATERWCRDDQLAPRSLRVLQAVSAPLGKLPMSMTSAMIRAQRPNIPLFGPAAPLAGMPARLLDASPLYAGETALRIASVVSAAEAVAVLAGNAGSPTIPFP